MKFTLMSEKIIRFWNKCDCNVLVSLNKNPNYTHTI